MRQLLIVKFFERFAVELPKRKRTCAYFFTNPAAGT
jgi:hypothetical protein